MRALVVLALLAGIAGAQPPAGDRKQAVDAFLDGEARFKRGDFAGAVEQFKIAYDFDPDPGYLFNIAQAYRFANDCVHAAKYYRLFLDRVPNPPNATKIRGWYASSEACASSNAPVPQVVQPSDPEILKPGIGFERAPPRPGAGGAPRVRDDVIVEERPSRRGLVVVAFATGAAALGTAGFFTWHAGNLEDDRARALATCTRSNPCDANTVTEIDARGKRANLIAKLGYGVGGAAIAGGTLVLLLSRGTETPLTVSPTPGGATVSARIRF
jgi:hypothetical protein